MTKSMLGTAEKACVNTSKNRPQRRTKQEGRSGSQSEPSELVRVGPKLGRRNTSRLLSFLKSGEKPADKIFKEAEKQFGNAGAQIRDASDRLLLSKRQSKAKRVRVSYPEVTRESSETRIYLIPFGG
jgi:hypothetical protein